MSVTAEGVVVDLRSDTVTQPSWKAREAASQALVGDDVYGEDPTVNKLEQRVADLLGKEASVFVPSATMANLAGIAAVVKHRGSAVLSSRGSHILRWEQEGVSSLLGNPMRAMPHNEAHEGELCLASLRTELSAAEDLHVAPVGAVTLENTHAESGGRALSMEYLAAVSALCREHSIPLHVDGARLVNAATTTAYIEKLSVTEALHRIAGYSDTVTLCLSKGLGAPVGAVIAGSAPAMHRARRTRKLLGGGMRQAGIIAGAALESLNENLERLGEDHSLAATFAEELSSIPGILVDPRPADATNIVFFQLATPSSATAEEDFLAALAQHGVLLGWGYKPRQLRAVTHRDVSLDAVKRALDAIRTEVMRL